MATYLVCDTFSSSEIIIWDDVKYTLGTDAFNDIVTAELVASQDSPDSENEIIVFAGNYTSSLNNFQNYEGITLNVTGDKYHEDDAADKATVTLKTFKNNGIATFAKAAFEATSVINNAGKTITLDGATFTADAVTNNGTFTIKGGATVNSTFTSTSIEKPGTIRLAGTINSKSAILGDNTISIASATTLDGATVVGDILDVKNHLTLKAATLTADTANITSGKYIIVDAGTSIINLDEVNFTGSTGITMKEGAFLTKSNIAGTVSVHTSATGVGATITGENTIEAILVPNKATAVKLNLSEANLTSDITVNGNGIVNALGENVVTGDITNNGVINVADGNSLGLNDGGLANAGTINLTGSITTTTTAQIANSGNIIVTGTGDLAAAVVMGDNGKVVFGTVDAAAETTFNGSITDISAGPAPQTTTYGKSTVQVLNGEVEFAKGSVVDIQGDAKNNRFTVGFRDAAIDPATVAATATVRGTVASHNGTWIGAAKAYDESFFDKKFFLVVDGGSYTNDANAFTVRASGKVIVQNGGSLSITDAAIRGDITVTTTSTDEKSSSMTFGSGNIYGENNHTATLTIDGSSLAVTNNMFLGKANSVEDLNRQGALVLNNGAEVTGAGVFNLTENGSITIDTSSSLTASSITLADGAEITIDAKNFGGGIVKVIDLSQDKALTNVTVNTGDTGAKVVYGDDGDVVIHDYTFTDVYVNADWAKDKQVGDAIEIVLGEESTVTAYYGINAFASVQKAYTDGAMNGTKTTVLKTFGTDKSSPDNVEIVVKTDGAYTLTGGDGGFVPYFEIDNAEGTGTTLTIDDADIMIQKFGARRNALVTVTDSVIEINGTNDTNAVYYNGTELLTDTVVWAMQTTVEGVITVSGEDSKYTNTWQTSVWYNGQITVSDGADWESAGFQIGGTNTSKDQTYINRKNPDIAEDAPATFIVDGAILNAGNNIKSKGGADYSYNTSHGIEVGTFSAAKLDILNDSVATLYTNGNATAAEIARTIKFGEFATVTVEDSELNIGGKYVDAASFSNAGSLTLSNGATLNATIATTNTGTITVSGSTFNAADTAVTNNGSFTVSGTSTINIGTLSGNAIEVAAGSTIKDSTIGGNLQWSEGTVTFKGENSVARLFDYDKVVVGKGDSLTLTGSRPTLGDGREINVTGDIEGKATETDKTTVTKSFETKDGFSLYGTGTGTLTVTNAYFVSGGNGITLKNKKDPEPGSLGTYTLTFTNSIADIKFLKMNKTGNDITATVTFDASVLNHDNNITNADPGSTMTFKNGSVANATSSFKNGGVFQVLTGSKFTANGVIQYGENSGNDGAITVDGKDSVMTLISSTSGHAFKSVEGASITVTNGGIFNSTYLTNEGTITIDTASLLTGTELTNTGTITIDARNLAPESYAKVIDLTQASALTGVSVLGDAHAIYGADGDVVVTNISAETLYVNSAWTINPATEKAYEFGDVVGEGMVYGINAFSDIATMVSGITSVTNKIKFLEGGTYDLNFTPATISQSMTFETDGVKPTIWHGEFNLGTKDGTGDSETYALNNDIYFFQFATNKYSPAVLTIDAELSIAQGIWFKAGTKTTVTEKGSIQRIDQYPWDGSAELQAGQFEVYGELTVNGTVNYFTQGATSYTFRIGKASEETYAGVLNVDGGNVHFMNNTHVDVNHPAYAPSLIDENGTVNLTNGGKLTVDQPLTNKGAINLNGNATFTANGGINNSGAIKLEVLPKEDEVLTETESTETEEEVPTETLTGGAFNKFTAKSISNSGTIDAKTGSTITTESGSFTNKTGAEVTVLGDSENLASTVIDAKKGISNSGSFSVTNATINVDGDALANTTNGVLTITNSIVNVGANYAFNNWAGSTTVSATTVNATINVFGGSFTIGEGASTLNGGFSGTAKLADGAVLKDSTVTKAYGAADIGTFTIATGASVGISGKNTLSAAITNKGTITIDATSSLSANSIAGGTIELTNFADNATRPVITVNGELGADIHWEYAGKEGGYDITIDQSGAFYTDDNKFLVNKVTAEGKTTVSIVKIEAQGTLLVNSDWSSLADGTIVTVDEKQFIIGFNAFATTKKAFTAAQNNKGGTIDFLKIGASQLSPSETITLTTAGDYLIVGGNTTDKFMSRLSMNGENANVLIGEKATIDEETGKKVYGKGAIVALGKLSAEKTEGVYLHNEFTVTNSIVGVTGGDVDGAAGWISFYNTSATIDNSIFGVRFSEAYGTADITTAPRSASDVKDAFEAGTYDYPKFGTNHSGPNVGIVCDLTVTDSTLATAFFNVRDRGIATVSNSVVYVGGSLAAGYKSPGGDNWNWGDKTSPEGFNPEGVATITFKGGSIVRNVGYGNGNEGRGMLVGGEKAGVIEVLEGSQLLMDASANKNNEDINVYGNGKLIVEGSSEVSGRNLSNAGTITLGNEAVGTKDEEGYKAASAGTLTADSITNSGDIYAYNDSVVTASKITNSGSFIATGTADAKATVTAAIDNDVNATVEMTDVVFNKSTDSVNKGEWTVKDSSLTSYSVTNYDAKSTFSAEDSTITMTRITNNGSFDVDGGAINTKKLQNAGIFTVGGEATLHVDELTGTINVLDGAELTATITGAEEADSAVVFDGKTTGITLAEGAVINTVAENYGELSADDLQVKTLINGASDGSVKGTFTAATLTAGSIVNNNGAAHKGGSTIELTGDLVAGDILNGVAPIVPGTDEPADKAFITAANITAGSIKNYGTVGSQAEGKELATITLTTENEATGKLTNGLYGNVFATTLNAASIENEGGIVVENINITSTDGVIENKAGGKIAQDNEPMTIAAKEIKNAGEISTHGGAITATAITNNAYNADTNDGLIWTDSITANGTVTNKGKIVLEDALFANRVVNEAGEFTVNGESKIVAVSGVANSGNVVVSGGKVTFNKNVTANNLNAQNASATININNATVSVAEKVYYYGTIVATNSVLDGIEFSDGGSGTGTLKVVNSSIDGIKLNGGTMQLDNMSLENVTIDGAFDVVGDSDFSGVNEVKGLTVSEGANLTISALATITSLTQPSLTVTAGDLVNHGTITIDAYGLEWGSTLKQLKVVSVTGEGKKAFSDGTITVKNAEDTMAIVQDDGIYLYYVKSSGETKTLFVNSAWSYAPGHEFEYDGQPLVFGMNAFQDADDIVFYANTDALVFVGGNATPYADLVWNKDDVSVTIDGGLPANFSDIKLGSATLTGDISAANLTFTGNAEINGNVTATGALTFEGDTVLNGKANVAALNIEKSLAMDWDNPIVAATLTAVNGSITIDVSEGLQNVLADTAVITTSGEAIDFADIVKNYDANEDIFAINEAGTTLSLSAKAIGKVSKGVTEDTDAGVYNSISKAVSNANTKLILIVSGDFGNASMKGKRTQVLTSGTVGNYYFAGGCNVSTEPLTEFPIADLYDDYKEFKGSTNVTIENGQFSTAVVIGADLVQLATSESSVTFFHIGDSNLTINGGHFEAAKNSSTGGYGERAIAGGMYYNIASGKTGEARLFGNVNLTITGGEFIGYNVYGGNFVNGTKVLCNRTHIKGNITLTLDATANELNFTANEGGFGGIVQAGSFGQSNVTGNSEVILKGAKGITFESLVGGSTSDDHILKNGKWTCESYVTGTRTLTFSGFTGDLDFSKVSDFTTVAFEGTNEVNFAGEFHRYFNDDVTNWVFEEGASLGGTVNFDFTGDSVDVLGSLELYKSNVTGFDIANVTYDKAKLAYEETTTSYLFTTIA